MPGPPTRLPFRQGRARDRGTPARLRMSVYRYGGEEFVVLLPEQSPAAHVMDRVREAFAALAIHTRTLHGVLTIRVGVVELDPSAWHAFAGYAIGQHDSAQGVRRRANRA